FIHNYISLIHENIKSRLLFCSKVHFATTSINVNGWGNTSTPDAINPLFSNHLGQQVFNTGIPSRHVKTDLES
ncbi:hypothetical protein, partial [Endozoicomonas acroporae]|uniref:hypothetical protein n=1 Tax=Endozoicomonas acroporae TaxID=1701104 RepID=UPI0019D5FE64